MSDGKKYINICLHSQHGENIPNLSHVVLYARRCDVAMRNCKVETEFSARCVLLGFLIFFSAARSAVRLLEFT